MARLSFALPGFERCERPRKAPLRACKLQPGRLAQGPDEKCGTFGRTVGIGVMGLSFQIGAPRWGGVSRRRKKGNQPIASSQIVEDHQQTFDGARLLRSRAVYPIP